MAANTIIKKYFLRKNNLIQLRHVPATRKKEEFKEWSRPKVCADGWAPYETITAIEQLNQELEQGLLTEIPSKYFEKNREKWLEIRKKDELEEGA